MSLADALGGMYGPETPLGVIAFEVNLPFNDERDLQALDTPWDPFSDQRFWHMCPGHEWRRFEWIRQQPGHAAEVHRITRCERCGAPRCDSLEFLDDEACESVRRAGGPDERDHVEQRYRCTAERHHMGNHDFLHAPAAA